MPINYHSYNPRNDQSQPNKNSDSAFTSISKCSKLGSKSYRSLTINFIPRKEELDQKLLFYNTPHDFGPFFMSVEMARNLDFRAVWVQSSLYSRGSRQMT